MNKGKFPGNKGKNGGVQMDILGEICKGTPLVFWWKILIVNMENEKITQILPQIQIFYMENGKISRNLPKIPILNRVLQKWKKSAILSDQ